MSPGCTLPVGIFIATTAGRPAQKRTTVQEPVHCAERYIALWCVCVCVCGGGGGGGGVQEGGDYPTGCCDCSWLWLIGRSQARHCVSSLSQVGPYVKMDLGQERAFFINSGDLTHVFKPCGHVTTEETAR